MPPRAVPSEDANQAMILGEMRGQLREVVHSVNNLSMKVDGLSREVIGLGPLAADILDLKIRMKVVEENDSRQAGATGVLAAILKSPAVGWLIGALATATALIFGTGKHP